jgi:hypothetical protein
MCVLRNVCDCAAGFVIIQLAVFLAATFARGQKVLLVVVVDLSPPPAAAAAPAAFSHSCSGNEFLSLLK